MRLIGLPALAIAAMAGLWYTSSHRLPYYYDAMIFILAITGAALLVDTSSASRSKRPRRIIRDGMGRDARIVFDSHQIVCQIGPWKWDIEEFCTHWFITGDTGAGKTSSGLNKLLISLTEHYPHWGALILDPKGVYWRTVQTMLQAAGRPADIAVLRVRSPQETAQHDHPLRFNLIGDRSVPCSTYAQIIVDTHAAHRTGSAAGNSDFFNQRAMEHISKCFELMRTLDLPFNLRTAYNLLVNKDHLKNTLDTVPDHPRARELLPLVQHFETFYLNLKSEGQSEGELGTIGNFLAPYQHPAVAEVFCSDQHDTITIDQVDQGKKICLSISEEYAHERKYLFSVLKLLFYQHSLRRLDLKARDPQAFWRKNLLVLVGEEFQDVVTSSVGGMSDYAVSGKIREANVALIVLTQSYLSLLPPHANKDQANVLVLNLRNRMIFRAADAECAKQSADFIGKKVTNKRSRSVGSRGVTYSYQETEEYKVKPHQLREMPVYRAVLVHAGRPGQFKRVSLKMLTGNEIQMAAENKLYER
jgi:Type IV secretory system Conjugative DNA transfer